MSESRAKHKLCRRIGECVWGHPKCPSIKRPYPAGQHGQKRSKKLSTYGTLLMEKQKLRAFYCISEKQLYIAYKNAKMGEGQTSEKLLRKLELRLDAVIFRSGMAPSVFSAKQFVSHRHIMVDGRVVDRGSYCLRPGQVVAIKVEKSPNVAEIAKKTEAMLPPYLEVDKENCKVTVIRVPEVSEVPVKADVMSVVEYYAR